MFVSKWCVLAGVSFTGKIICIFLVLGVTVVAWVIGATAVGMVIGVIVETCVIGTTVVAWVIGATLEDMVIGDTGNVVGMVIGVTGNVVGMVIGVTGNVVGMAIGATVVAFFSEIDEYFLPNAYSCKCSMLTKIIGNPQSITLLLSYIKIIQR